MLYNTFSFAHPPALRIKPGDRVITTTIEAGGIDASDMSEYGFDERTASMLMGQCRLRCRGGHDRRRSDG